MVLKHLEDFGCITSWDAIIEYGITSPTKRISELRADGVKIDFITCHKKNRYGKRISFYVYFIENTLMCLECGIFFSVMYNEYYRCPNCSCTFVGISGEESAKQKVRMLSGKN